MAKKKHSEAQDAKPVLKEDIQLIDLSAHAEKSYLDYGVSVVKGRALPWIEDGLKPVQRRILYAMKLLGLTSNAKPMKSARVVGDVLGKYHPHGDASVYDAMVRTAQDFSLRYPLVDGQGNFGSRDGDGAAAMRYTEARMTGYADTFLSELGMGTVDWRPTYDNQNEEPYLLPSRLPNLLLNGARGIAVGIATEIPPHNLVETVDACVALLKNPKLTLEEAMAFISGPDFPTGGQIISSPEEIRKAYAEGKGPIRMRAKWRIEHEGTKNWRIVIDELPYTTSAQKVVEEIDLLFNPKAKEKKGKKIFTPEQLRQKALVSNLIEDFGDRSDHATPMRLVIEPKSHKVDPQEIITTLLAYTSMETNYPMSLVTIGRDKAPRQKPLMDILREWTSFRVDTVERRTIYEHKKASDRLHILQGRLTILDHIEEVVRILKNSDDPKQALIDRFQLSDVQADDVLEIRLRQLARLEKVSIEEEIKKLEAEIARLNKLLESKTALKNQVIKELEADKKSFGDARRTVIEEAQRVAAKVIEETAISDDPVTVAFSERGWIRVKAGHQHAAESFGFKAGDSVKSIRRAKMSDFAIFIDESGKSYSTQLSDLPSAKGGEDVPIATLADFGAKLAVCFVGSAGQKAVLATSSGYGFVCKLSDMITRLKAGKALISVEPGATILEPVFLPEGVNADQTAFATLSTNGRLLVYRLSEINELSKGKGVALCGLDEGQRLAQVAVLADNELVLEVEGLKRPVKLSTEEFAKHFQGRSSSKKGRPVEAAKGRPVQFAKAAAADAAEQS